MCIRDRIKSGAKLGDYESASDYGKLYDVAKKAEASIRNTASGDLLESEMCIRDRDR